MGQPTKPTKSLDLVVSQFGIECRRHFCDNVACILDPFQTRFPVFVRLESTPLIHVAESRRSNLRKSQRTIFAFPIRSQFAKPMAHLFGQRKEATIVERNEATRTFGNEIDEL